MPMNTHTDRLQGLCDQVKSLAEDLAQNPPQRIGYRERIRIERPLFLLVKEVCQNYLGYDLHGLNEIHRKELSRWMEDNQCHRSLQNFIRETFELRVFVVALSSANPYVRGDALSRASITKSTTVATLSRKLQSLAERTLDE